MIPQIKPKFYIGLVCLLLGVILALGAYTFYQHNVIQAAEEKASVALEQFLKEKDVLDKDAANGVGLGLHNVKFHWNKNIFIHASQLDARAIPVGSDGEVGTTVDFDDLDSFVVDLGQSQVRVLPSVLEGMLNQSVFNYPNSKMKELSVSIVPHDEKGHALKLKGRIQYLFWIPFQMIAHLDIDKDTNTLVITVEDLSVLGFIPAKSVIQLKPFNLDKLLTVPENKHLTLQQNKIFVKPFGLFPPPRLTGTLGRIAMSDKFMVLFFEGQQPKVSSDTRNGIYLKGGRANFAALSMEPVDIEVIDKQQNTPFVFPISEYQNLLSHSAIQMEGDGSLTVTMPDGTP